MKRDVKKSKWFVILGMIAVSVTAAVFAGAYIIQSPAHIGNNSNNTHDGNRNQSISYATYTTANFTMNYPANWTVVPTASKYCSSRKTDMKVDT